MVTEKHGTTQRVLSLLNLLQSRPVWTGPELADRLGVTTRSIRRDVERLRDLGYPVNAAQGVGGGYQLGRGRELPPLLLDDDEAVAVAVALRLAAVGAVAEASEAAVRTLAKLDQVLPSRLRHQVRAIADATDTWGGQPDAVSADVLQVLARACRDHERVSFVHTKRDGDPSPRSVEPYRLVATARRWYLMAFDLDRDDWRTFRLDRVRDASSSGWRFRPREHEDPVAFVRRSVTVAPYDHQCRVRFQAPAADVRQRVPQLAGTVEEVDEQTCELTAGAQDLDALAFHVVRIGFPCTVVEPPALVDAVRDLASRLTAAISAS